MAKQFQGIVFFSMPFLFVLTRSNNISPLFLKKNACNNFLFFPQLILKKAQVQMLQNRIFQSRVSLDFALLVIHGCRQLNSPRLVLSGAPVSPQSQANQVTESRAIKARQPIVSQTTWFFTPDISVAEKQREIKKNPFNPLLCVCSIFLFCCWILWPI